MKVITIGRGPENNVVIDDYKISRTHLQIVENNGVYSIVDLNSANGTYVNGQRISGEVRLQPNDVVKIGDTTLQWQKYFNAHTAPEPSTTLSNPTITPKRQSWVCYAVVGVLVVLVGIVFGIIVSKNKQKLAQKDDELRDISNTLEETRKQKTELEKELNALEGYSEDFAQIAKDNKLTLEDKIYQLSVASASLKATNEELEKKLSKANTEIDNLKNKQEELNKGLETARTKISELETTKNALNVSLTTANDKVGDLEEAVQKITSENMTLQEKNTELARQGNANKSQQQKMIQTLKTENENLKKELENCQQQDSIAAIVVTEDKANAQNMAEVAEQKPIASGVNSEDNNNAEQQNNK